MDKRSFMQQANSAGDGHVTDTVRAILAGLSTEDRSALYRWLRARKAIREQPFFRGHKE